SRTTSPPPAVSPPGRGDLFPLRALADHTGSLALTLPLERLWSPELCRSDQFRRPLERFPLSPESAAHAALGCRRPDRPNCSGPGNRAPDQPQPVPACRAHDHLLPRPAPGHGGGRHLDVGLLTSVGSRRQGPERNPS